MPVPGGEREQGQGELDRVAVRGAAREPEGERLEPARLDGRAGAQARCRLLEGAKHGATSRKGVEPAHGA